MRLGFDSRRAQRLDIVAEWLTRLTANQFLSRAQVRVLPMSFFLSSLAGAMVARLPTEQEVVGSIPTSGLCGWLSWGRGFDPRVGLYAPLAQSVEHKTLILSLAFLAQSVEHCANNFSRSRDLVYAAVAGSIPAESFFFGVIAQR